MSPYGGKTFPVQFAGVDAKLSEPPPFHVAEKAGEIEMKTISDSYLQVRLSKRCANKAEHQKKDALW